MGTHRPESRVVKTSCIWVVGGIEQDGVDDLLDRDPTNILGSEEGEGSRGDGGGDGLLDVHCDLDSKGRTLGIPLTFSVPPR